VLKAVSQVWVGHECVGQGCFSTWLGRSGLSTSRVEKKQSKGNPILLDEQVR